MSFSNNLPSGKLSIGQQWNHPKFAGVQKLFQDLTVVQSSFPDFQQYQANRDQFIKMLHTLHSNN